MHKLYNIQSLRGIAALLVVLSHLLIIVNKTANKTGSDKDNTVKA